MPTLGICLGAQLMALALGGSVTKGPVKEIGLYPLTFTEEGRRSCLGVFEGVSVLHWHGDAIGLPEGAVRLASTAAFPNQAFSFGSHALGVQFHPEAGGPGFERWLIGHAVELAEAEIDVPALRGAYREASASLAAKAERCLLDWLAEVAPDAVP
jgi:GMP synthase (glutamine-hydrolysing)